MSEPSNDLEATCERLRAQLEAAQLEIERLTAEKSALQDELLNAGYPLLDTEMAHPAFEDGERERIAGAIPIGRIASADDVAGPIVFLCSALGRHVTGEILNVNGGAVLVG